MLKKVSLLPLFPAAKTDRAKMVVVQQNEDLMIMFPNCYHIGILKSQQIMQRCCLVSALLVSIVLSTPYVFHGNISYCKSSFKQ